MEPPRCALFARALCMQGFVFFSPNLTPDLTDMPRTIDHSTSSATSASWRTSMPARRRRPSASSTTPAAPTRWVRSTRALPSWTGWSRSRSAASRSPPPRPPASGRTTASTSSTRPATSTSPSRSSARCACSTAPSRCSTPSPASSPVRDGLAPGRQVPRPAHRLHQQDGPHRRRLRRAPSRRCGTASARTRCRSRSRSGQEADFKGVIDLVTDRALIWKDELGTEWEEQEIPADLAERRTSSAPT